MPPARNVVRGWCAAIGDASRDRIVRRLRGDLGPAEKGQGRSKKKRPFGGNSGCRVRRPKKCRFPRPLSIGLPFVFQRELQ